LKLAWFFAILLAIPALAQPSAPHGTRIGQVQIEYLNGPSGDQAALIQQLERVRQQMVRTSGANPLVSSSITRSDWGPHVEFETWVEQLSRDYSESVVAGSTGVEREAGKATIHRFVRDNFRHTNQTYTMTFETVPGRETVRVSFSDSSIAYPVPQILREGETIALTLAVDERTGRKLVDYIRAGSGLMSSRQQVPRDVYAEDAVLTITQPRLRANGIEQKAESLPEMVSAQVLWVDIPGQGRFDLSFKPRADQGFERAGEVSENSLMFSSGGNIFRIDCAERIATGSGTYNIYARKEPAGNPPDGPIRIAFGAQR
jgi:hypothetical protein